MADQELNSAISRQVFIWDLPIRITHWALVLAFVGAYVTNRLGVNYFKYHLWCGFAVIVLVVFRILWGILGTHHARFGNFIRGPITTLRYAWQWLRGKEAQHAGHNPLGAWMVVLLLATLFVQAFTGLFGDDQIMNLGPLYGYVSAETSSVLTSLHRNLFYWIAAAVAVHVVAVIAHCVFKKDNLVGAMITGRKAANRVAAHEAIDTSRAWRAVLLLGVVAAILASVVSSAPAPIASLTFD